MHRFYIETQKIKHTCEDHVCFLPFFFYTFYSIFKFIIIIILITCKFANQILLFQDALTFRGVIALCYGRQTMALQSHILSLGIWANCEVVNV